MSDLNRVLKTEITRLARRSLRPNYLALKKDVAWLRHQVAGHRRQIARLQRDNARLMADLNEKLKTAPKASTEELKHARLSPRLIRSQRKRLGLSREKFAKLIGVSSASVLAWEGGKTKPRAAAKASLVAVRKLKKREANERLQVLSRADGAPQKQAGRKKKQPGERR